MEKSEERSQEKSVTPTPTPNSSQAQVPGAIMVQDQLVVVAIDEELDVSDSLELQRPRVEIQVENTDSVASHGPIKQSSAGSVFTPIVTTDFDFEKMMQLQAHLQKLEKNFKIMEVSVENLEERTESNKSALRSLQASQKARDESANKTAERLKALANVQRS